MCLNFHEYSLKCQNHVDVKCGITLFKNCFSFANLVCHEADYGLKADWSFFETAHGKGLVDGVGGEIKRMVWKLVLQGKAVVSDFESFFKMANGLEKR